MLDPATTAALIETIGGLVLSFAKKPEKPQVTPSDVFQRQGTKLPGEGGTESQLAGLQANLYKMLMQQAGSGLPGQLNLGGIAAGAMPETSRARIDQMAFGGLQESGRRASAAGMERALAQGTPMSSWQYGEQAGMMEPLAAQAGQLRAQLEMQELGRLADLRQVALANMMQMQESPALTRLLQIRMQQPTTSNLQLTRRPGGLPRYSYGSSY